MRDVHRDRWHVLDRDDLRRRGGCRCGRSPDACFASRKQRERIDVAVRLGREPNPDVDIRLGNLGLAARPNGAHRLALLDARANRNADRA